MKHIRAIFLCATLAILAATAPAARAQTTITFDEVTASPYYSATVPGGPAGPTVSYSTVTFDGGVILNGSNFGNYDTTPPNLYATTDHFTLSGGSSLPGFITGTLATPGSYQNIGLDIGNGLDAGNFTLTAFDSSSTMISSDTVALTGYGTLGAVGHLALSGANISYFTVTSDQAKGNIDFGIDTVVLGNPSVNGVPEPSSMIGIVIGVLGLALISVITRRRSTLAQY